MLNNLKFIGQYSASVSGTHKTEIIDIFYNGIDKMYLYRRYSNGEFSFETIERNSYNSNPKHNKFDGLLESPDSYTGITLFVSWRTKYIPNPTLMPERYYYDILSFHLHNEKVMNNKIRYVKENLEKCFKQTIDDLEN